MKGLFVLSLLVLVALSFTGTYGDLTCANKLAPCATNPDNAYMACVDTSFVQAIKSFLPESKAVNKSLINPNDWNSNVIFDFSNESKISGKPKSSFEGYINITLLWEGAGYRNQFGYFLYTTDEDGKHPKIKQDKHGNDMQYILFKDVSFPPPSDACLQSGVSVDIGPFFDGDNVGFFVGPNWFNSKSLKPLYSVSTLNAGSEVHFFVFSLQGSYVLGIEDVILGSSDKDYNDVVFQFQTTKGAIVDVPILDPCPGTVPCNGHGICNATTKSCICESGPGATYYGDNCENSYTCPGCQQGICVSDGVCSCSHRYGDDCASCAEGLYAYPTCKDCQDLGCDHDQTCTDVGDGTVKCQDPPPPHHDTPTCSQKPWGDKASDYSIFVRGDLTASNSDVQGRIAAGGDISLSLYSIAEGLNPNDDDSLTCSSIDPSWAAVAGGNFKWDNGNARIGSLAYGSTNQISASVSTGLATGCSVLSSNPIDFRDAFDYLTGVSDYFDKTDSNGETTYDDHKNILYLTATHQPDSFLFFFDVDADDLSNANSVIFGNFNDMTVKLLVINVDVDDHFSFKDTSFETVLQGPSVNLGQKIVWNFRKADSITIKSISLPGVILAPQANVKGTNGVLWGQIFAASFSGDLQVNYPVGSEQLCLMTDIIEAIPKVASACAPCSTDADQKDDCTCVCKRPCATGYFADPAGSCACVCPVNNNCVLGQDNVTCLCYGADTPAVDSGYCFDSYEGGAWPAWLTDFQIVTKKDLSLKSTRTGGRIAAGGNTVLKRIAVGDRLSSNSNPTCTATNGRFVDGVILANGPLFFKSGSVTGNILAGDYTQLSEYLSIPLQVTQGLAGCLLPRPATELLASGGDWNFDDAFEQLQTYSNALADKDITPVTGQAYFAYEVLTLWGYGLDLEVFRVDNDDLKQARRIDLKGISSTATIIIDITGSDVSIRDVGTTSLLPFARSLVWNAARAGTFSFKNVALPGLILAPSADIENPVGRLLGYAFVESFTAQGNIGIDLPFGNWAGCLPRTNLLGQCDSCPAGYRRLNPTNCDCTQVVFIQQSAVTRFFGDSGALVTFKINTAGGLTSGVTLNFPNDGSCLVQRNNNTVANVFSLVLQKDDASSGLTYSTPSYAGFTATSFSFIVVFENKEVDSACSVIPTPNIIDVVYEPIPVSD